MSEQLDLSIDALKSSYAAGTFTPSSLVTTLHPAIEESGCTFISKPTLDQVLERCKFLESQPPDSRGPLWGIPFAVKDNIDVAGFPTTCACPSFNRHPDIHAPAVQALHDAGAIFMGKTNMDQFASGLVGTRSPYGVPTNSFDDRFCPGGSSSGSGPAVAAGLVSFALGTDTAGSGRVPAGTNGIVGIKPSLGKFSTTGVVPACYLLDCVSVFALKVKDGAFVAEIMDNKDKSDATWRPRNLSVVNRTFPDNCDAGKDGRDGGQQKTVPKFRFGMPSRQFLRFDGKVGGERAATAMLSQMELAAERMTQLGGEQVDIDYAPFEDIAASLYGGAFVAERYSGIRHFLEEGGRKKVVSEDGTLQVADVLADDRLLKVIRYVIAKAINFTAVDLFEDMARQTHLKARARMELEKIDVLVVPTAAYNYLIAEIQEQEIKPNLTIIKSTEFLTRNANLGRFTNFVNLMDMCGVSVPSGLITLDYSNTIDDDEGNVKVAARKKILASTGKESFQVPFGITLLAPSWNDTYLAGLAMAYETVNGVGPGPRGHGVVPYKQK